MIASTKLAKDVVKGDRLGRKTVVTLAHERPDGRYMFQTHHRGQKGHGVTDSYAPDEYVRVYVNNT